jgi:hypothetical protein
MEIEFGGASRDGSGRSNVGGRLEGTARWKAVRDAVEAGSETPKLAQTQTSALTSEPEARLLGGDTSRGPAGRRTLQELDAAEHPVFAVGA